MKNESAFAKKFTTLYRRIKKGHYVDMPVESDPIGQLVMAFLQWNATTKAAATAYKRIAAITVDHNDLRVSHLHEIVDMLGLKYANVEDRVQRLIAALQEIYVREHAVSLDSLAKKSKKDVRAYLESIPGMASYVAAQVTLLSFAGHAIPVDDVLADRLRREGAVDPEATVGQISSFLERQIRAADALTAHAVLRAWSDSSARRQSSSATKPVKKKTTKTKTTTKKSTKATAKRTTKKTKKTTKKKTTRSRK